MNYEAHAVSATGLSLRMLPTKLHDVSLGKTIEEILPWSQYQEMPYLGETSLFLSFGRNCELCSWYCFPLCLGCEEAQSHMCKSFCVLLSRAPGFYFVFLSFLFFPHVFSSRCIGCMTCLPLAAARPCCNSSLPSSAEDIASPWRCH